MPPTSRGPSFALRAFAAVALMVGFYLLAIGLLVACGGLVWADLTSRRVHPKLLFVCAVVAFGIVRGVFFFTDAFVPPGPELEPARERRLFAVIDDIAAKLGARRPQHVYLMADVNAFVADVGGWLGIVGSRRVLAIGVGMLNTDTVGQLKATIAHEFGHFQGGDTRLGGFLYRTRASLGRVVQSLGEDSWISAPFRWYGALFLRLTQAISRRQELAADEFSVQIAGKSAHVEGLRREAVGGLAFSEFLDSEVAPLLDEGFRPVNLFEGYRVYLESLGDDGVLARVEASLDQRSTDPHDSHPALRERIAYAQALPDVPARREDDPARDLLASADDTERMMTRWMLSSARTGSGDKPRELGWGEVAGTVYAARIGRAAQSMDKLLGEGSGLAAVLDHLENTARPELALKVVEAFGHAGAEQSARILTQGLGARLALELAKLPGAAWETKPGRGLFVRLADGRLVDPFALVAPAVDDPASVPALRAALAKLGLPGHPTEDVA